VRPWCSHVKAIGQPPTTCAPRRRLTGARSICMRIMRYPTFREDDEVLTCSVSETLPADEDRAMVSETERYKANARLTVQRPLPHDPLDRKFTADLIALNIRYEIMTRASR
jgi:hypothetical protein